MDKIKRYFRNLGVAATQFLGALSGITINANETTSGAAYRRRNDDLGWLYRGINKTFFWQDNHCLDAVIKELIDSSELVDVYNGLIKSVAEVPNVLIAAAPEVIAESKLSDLSKRRIWDAQAKARDEESTGQDPQSPSFDAQTWFDGLADNAKRRIVEVGVSIAMSTPNRKKVARISQVWHNAGATPRAGHGMVG